MMNTEAWIIFLSPSAPGKAYPPEFYYDTYNPVWQNKPRTYSFKLQWTQMNPNAVDRIVAYRLGFRQVRRPGVVSRAPHSSWFWSTLSSKGKWWWIWALLNLFRLFFEATFTVQHLCFPSEMLVFLSVLFSYILQGCRSRAVRGTGVAEILSEAVVSMSSRSSNCHCFLFSSEAESWKEQTETLQRERANIAAPLMTSFHHW